MKKDIVGLVLLFGSMIGFVVFCFCAVSPGLNELIVKRNIEQGAAYQGNAPIGGGISDPYEVEEENGYHPATRGQFRSDRPDAIDYE